MAGGGGAPPERRRVEEARRRGVGESEVFFCSGHEFVFLVFVIKRWERIVVVVGWKVWWLIDCVCEF